MAVAAPGEVPYSAVAPGIRPERLISQPIAAAPSSVAAITRQNNGASWMKLATMAGVMALAIIAPSSPRAPTYGNRGVGRRRPFTPKAMPLIIGPSSRARRQPGGAPNERDDGGQRQQGQRGRADERHEAAERQASRGLPLPTLMSEQSPPNH